MQSTVTLKTKLIIKPKDLTALDSIKSSYVEALNQTSKIAFESGYTSSVSLHHATYQTMRTLTLLPANLVCSARCIVSEAYKREAKPKKQHTWSGSAGIRFDERTLRLKLDAKLATLSTKGGRIEVGLVLSDYHSTYLDGSWKIAKTATLIKRKGVWYLCLIADKEIADATGDEVIGVDSGIQRIATVSTGKVFKGNKIKHIRRQRFKQRRSIQSTGHKSRAQRRLLKRLAGKENRSVEWLLWNVANGIVNEALKANASEIAFEDLKHIRDRIRVAKKQRLIHHGWPFASLMSKAMHVASKHGIRFVEVDAAYTSQRCNRCGHCEKANRKSQSKFACKVCGHKNHADDNASFNIRDRRVLSRMRVVTPRSVSVFATDRESRLL